MTWMYVQGMFLIERKRICRDFPGGPMVKNPPCNAGEVGSIPGQRTRIPQRGETKPPPRNYWATTRESTCHQWKFLPATTKAWYRQINKYCKKKKRVAKQCSYFKNWKHTCAHTAQINSVIIPVEWELGERGRRDSDLSHFALNLSVLWWYSVGTYYLCKGPTCALKEDLNSRTCRSEVVENQTQNLVLWLAGLPLWLAELSAGTYGLKGRSPPSADGRRLRLGLWMAPRDMRYHPEVGHRPT